MDRFKKYINWTINPVEKGEEVYVVINGLFLAVSITFLFFLLAKISTISSITKLPIASILSIGSAVVSVYFAFRSLEQNRMSQIPILEAYISDVVDPHVLKIKIQNIGNGVAKQITAKLLPINKDIPFASDLIPRKHTEFNELYLTEIIEFEGNRNPLFNEGELCLFYQDIWGNKYKTRALFKPDVDITRRALGHIDINLSGSFYH